MARRCDQYSDHGHDHMGVDRGADLHPALGYNFRISELHAAVGLAQIRKLDGFLATQRRNKKALRAALETVPGVTFRRIPDPEGDSASFLSFFLPDEARARAAAKAMQGAGIPAMYWYDNNWHYVRRWDHLKTPSSFSPLPAQRAGGAGAARQPTLPGLRRGDGSRHLHAHRALLERGAARGAGEKLLTATSTK